MLEALFAMDKSILIALNSVAFKPFAYFMYLISLIGNYAVIWLFFCLLALILDKKNGKKVTIYIIASLIIVLILEAVIESFFTRQRPYLVLQGINLFNHLPIDSSFPSSHAASAFAGAVIFSSFYKKYKWHLYIFAFLTAASRVYLAVHYPSDVIAGAIEGFIIGILLLSINQKLSNKDKKEKADKINIKSRKKNKK